MATMTLANRATKGAAYSSALATWLAALVDLAACEILLGDQISGKFPALGDTVDLRSISHPTYAPVVSTSSLGDLIRTQIAVLNAS